MIGRMPWWTWHGPSWLGACCLAVSAAEMRGPVVVVGEAVVLVATVFAAVWHAEVVAHRVGEPFGTLVLALAVTVIEMALIVSIASGEHRSAGCQSPQPERPFPAL
jgi:Ca2+:H+ antiporter